MRPEWQQPLPRCRGDLAGAADHQAGGSIDLARRGGVAARSWRTAAAPRSRRAPPDPALRPSPAGSPCRRGRTRRSRPAPPGIAAAVRPCRASIAPMVIRSLLVNSAVGGSARPEPAASRAPSSRLRGPCRTSAGSGASPCRRTRPEPGVALLDRPDVLAVTQVADPPVAWSSRCRTALRAPPGCRRAPVSTGSLSAGRSTQTTLVPRASWSPGSGGCPRPAPRSARPPGGRRTRRPPRARGAGCRSSCR